MRLIFFSLILTLLACSAAKDRKAIGRVMSSKELMARVGALLPPCANDTTIVHDTTLTVKSVTLYDTTIERVNDTVVRVVRQTDVIEKLRIKEVSVVDNRAVEAWRDSTARYMNYYLAKDIELKEAEAGLKSAKQQGKTRLWIIISLALALLLSNGLWLAGKFK